MPKDRQRGCARAPRVSPLEISKLLLHYYVDFWTLRTHDTRSMFAAPFHIRLKMARPHAMRLYDIRALYAPPSPR